MFSQKTSATGQIGGLCKGTGSEWFSKQSDNFYETLLSTWYPTGINDSTIMININKLNLDCFGTGPLFVIYCIKPNILDENNIDAILDHSITNITSIGSLV